jgi:hypothetical protein
VSPLVRTWRPAARKVAAGNRSGAERGEVSGFHLAVDYAESALLEVCAQMREGDFRGIAHVGEHRFAVKGVANCDAIETAGEFAADPGFDAVGVTNAVQFG